MRHEIATHDTLGRKTVLYSFDLSPQGEEAAKTMSYRINTAGLGAYIVHLLDKIQGLEMRVAELEKKSP